MGKVYIGVTAVGGHKLWGGGRQEGCGVRWFGGMGERRGGVKTPPYDVGVRRGV